MLGEELGHHPRDRLVVVDDQDTALTVGDILDRWRPQRELEHERVRLGPQRPAVQLGRAPRDHQRHAEALPLRLRRLPERLQRLRPIRLGERRSRPGDLQDRP